MGQNYITKILQIKGMTCISCENRIERVLSKTDGILSVKASYTKETVTITFDSTIINLKKIESLIEDLDYTVINTKQINNESNGYRTVGFLIIILALYLIINRFGGFNIFNSFPTAKAGMGYGMLFIIGLLTSTHCIAMCGGINLSQCVPNQGTGSRNLKLFGKLANLNASILYNSGRVISYTVIGGIVGAMGSVISFSSGTKGFIAILAGAFMVIMGMNMLNVFPWLRKFNPRMPKIFAVKINEQKKSNKPFYVGLLNGLMPCGPLQAMQLYALSTGDPMKGALSMLLFSLGTVPLMFGLGALSTILSRRFTKKMMTVSAALVLILGLFMVGNGMALSGYSAPFATNVLAASDSKGNIATAEIIDGVQVVRTSLKSGGYEPIVVQAGIPVQWNIQAEAADINGCNNRIVISEYNIERDLVPGDNMIEFTPEKSGVIPYSCWMGMIRSQINIIDDINDQSEVGAAAENSPDALPSCCQ